MILQEEFEKCGYQDILIGDSAPKYEISLDDIFDIQDKPEELLSIYISEQCDELFFLLNGDVKDINSICKYWDDRIRVFTIINDKRSIIRKLKYNIVQLIVCSRDIPDRRIQSNLLITRKIIIKGSISNVKQIIINDAESIELPFHMIPTDAYRPDADCLERLNQLLPDNDTVAAVLKEQITRKNERLKNGVTVKTLSKNEYECIKEWLDGENT